MSPVKALLEVVHDTGFFLNSRDLSKMKTAPQALTKRTMTDFVRDELEPLR
jgi:hypothetical protein